MCEIAQVRPRAVRHPGARRPGQGGGTGAADHDVRRATASTTCCDSPAVRRRPASAAVDTAADDVALIAFTSGTTGRPKGCMHFHRDVLAVADTFSRHVLRPGPGRRVRGQSAARLHLRARRSGGLPDAGRRLRAAARTGGPQAAVARASPSTGSRCCSPRRRRTGRCSTSSDGVRHWPRCAAASRPGENLPAATWRAWYERTGLRIINGIGATELLHIFISAADGDDPPRHHRGSRCRAGRRACWTRTASRLPDGEPGLLAVRGPVGCRYLADARQRAYVRDGWNITGDTYVREPDGYFRYVARADDMIISAGYNIAGPEVEEALLRHPDVVETAVVGRSDEARGQIVVAYVVPREGARASDDGGAARVRQGGAGAVQVPARDRLPARPAPDGDGQAPALPAAQRPLVERYRLTPT